MALNSFNAYHSYLKSIEPLNDSERGRLFTALLEYSSTGIAPELRGNERFVFPTMKEQIDRDREKYEARCAQNSKNIGIRWNTNVNDRIRTNTNVSKDKDKDKDKDRPLRGNSAQGAKKKSPPVPWDECDELAKARGFSPQLEHSVLDWLKYKRERGDSYNPTGLTSLLTQIKNAENTYGAAAVAEVIAYSMGNMYMGIVFDRLKKGGAVVGARGTATEGAKPKRDWGITYDV